ncbi:MAG: hypothetical protein UAR70_01930 [Buchnera aphidicola (Chaetogeoica yunlongensis)]
MIKFFQILIAFFSGSIGVLSFSPWEYWPCAIISFIGLKTTLHFSKKKNIQVSTIGFFWGVGLFSNGIYWIYISLRFLYKIPTCTSLLILLILIAYLSLYPMLFSIIITYIQSKFKSQFFLIISSSLLWIIIEYIRENLFTGFPWLEFGYSQINSPLKNIAPIMGIHGITVILITISELLYLFLLKKKYYTYCLP